MRTCLKRNSGWGAVVCLCLLAGPSKAQDGVGGVNSLFSAAGVGSRALALGSAYVAAANDPTVVFWNPAGLDFLEKKSASFYYSSLVAGSSYNYLGFVYPSVSVGSFGFGWIRIGVDGVTERDEAGVPGNVSSFSQQQFLFSYGKQIFQNFSAGLSIKIERFNFSDFNLTDTGFGGDLGLLYRPDFDNGLLRDLSVGLNVQNLFRPRTRLQEQSVPSPVNLKFGLAKPFHFGMQQNALTFLLDFDKSEDAPSMYHLGAEYSFQNRAMLRLGVNDGQVAFGAGATYQNFRFDYSFGKLFDGVDFSGNHRFTITVEFGKGKHEVMRIAAERREREQRRQFASQMWFTRETEFNSSMEDGREKYYNGDYLGAYAKFQSALDAANGLVESALKLRGEMTDDPEANVKVETANSALEEAQNMLELANAKYDTLRKKEREQFYVQGQRSGLEEQLSDFIIKHRERGNALFKEGNYSRAIDEWKLVLDRIADNKNADLPKWVNDVRGQVENDIKTAEEQLAGNIRDKIRRADNLAHQGNFVQALNVLNELRGLGLSGAERSAIESKINSLQSQLSFKQSFEQGLQNYARKDWANAAKFFEAALKIKPKDPKALKYYDQAQARARATLQDMPPEIRGKFARGMRFFKQKRYTEALKIWEEVRQQQPYNKIILDAIDNAKERIGRN